MASSVNNIAATFATVSKTTSSSSSTPRQQNFPLSASPKSISTSWNPHATIPKSQRSSLLNFYGPPGPPPSIQPISAVEPRRQMIDERPGSLRILVGKKVPNVALCHLGRNDAVQTVTLSSLCRGRKVVLVGVSAAFSAGCARFVKRVELTKAKGSDLIACVAVNDVFVMKAWGEHLAVGDRVMMLSDGRGELASALGASLDTSGQACLGLGVRSKRFCLNTFNGVIMSVDFDDEFDGIVSFRSTVV